MFFIVSVLKKAFNFIKKRLQHRRFSAKFLRTPFLTEHLRWLLLAMGAPYLVKLQVTFFIKKIELHSPGFLPQFKKSCIPEMPFAGHTFAECFSMAAY